MEWIRAWPNTHYCNTVHGRRDNIRIKKTNNPEVRSEEWTKPDRDLALLLIRFRSFSFTLTNRLTAVEITALNIFLCLPLAPASARIFFFLLLLRNKVAILLHCLYKPSRILIFFLKESRALSFLAISINLESLTRRQGLEKCLVVYILMHERRTRGGGKAIGSWK